ncbi:MAG: TadE/TadG family type IV pilus assembly protein [Candidatus Dormibacteria bacterium]
MSLRAQRGNVTLITAFTAMLMVLVVVLAAGLSNSAGDATRMQAASDQAALTAAETYISVVNDTVAFDLIDWGLGFLSRMAEVVQSIGEAIAAVPFLEWLGAAIVAVGEFVQTAADSAKDVFDGIKDTLNDILDQAKEILAVINATVAAANNGYLGFILPSGILNQASNARYTVKDINDFVDHARQPMKDAGLFNAMKATAMHAIWGTGAATTKLADCKKSDGKPCGAPACGSVPGTSQTCGKPEEKRSSDHDTFNLWPDTDGCVDPPAWTDVNAPKPKVPAGAWHRPCDEREWLRSQLRTSLLDTERGLIDVRIRINFNVPDNKAYDSKKPTLFDDGGDANAQKTAWDSLVAAEQALDAEAKGSGNDPDKDVNAAVSQLTDYYERAPPTFPGLPTFKTPFGSYGPRVFCRAPLADPHPGFTCAGTIYDSGADLCKRPDKPATPPNFTDMELFPCWNFWGFDPNNDKKDQMQKRRDAGPLPDSYPVDYRKTQSYAADVSGSKTLGDWKAYKFEPHSTGNIADNQDDVNESFIMINQVNPTDEERLLRQVAGGPAPKQHWTITGSKAIIHRADSAKDAVHASSLCNNFKDHSTDKLLGFIPKTPYGWCRVLLGAFDVFKDIYDAIHNFFFDKLIQPMRDFSIDLPIVGNICPFCWLADILEGLVNYVLGPAPPDTRTYHIALVTVGCVPAVQQVADVANNFDLEKVIKLVINKDSSLSDPNNDTCSGAPSSSRHLPGAQPPGGALALAAHG